VLLCIARDPGVRLRDIAASVGITERRVETHLPVPEPADRHLAIGDLLVILGDEDAGLDGTGPGPG
jgi:hypothetical protein